MVPTPQDLGDAVSRWLSDHKDRLPDVDGAGRSFPARLTSLVNLQRALFDNGWARYGWPTEIGGLGGGILHRAAVAESLAYGGFPDRGPFEHQEILLPVLQKRARPGQLAPLARAFLRGDTIWTQGFSEREAGPDLAAVRTRAIRDGDTYRVTGRKVWTSWASFADFCVLTVPAGAAGKGHRGLSVLIASMGAPGVSVSAIRQSNGHDELAEVEFDDVLVPCSNRIGAEGEGWAIATDIRSYERGTSSWLRQLLSHDRAEELLRVARLSASHLGDVLLDLHALRLTAGEAMLGEVKSVAGPAAAPVKLVRTDAEQHLYDMADASLDGALAPGSTDSDQLGHWQGAYLFSRAVSVYGGTRQMQLATVARHLLGVGR